MKGNNENREFRREWITGAKSDFLNELIKDCIYYNLGDDDSLRYIEMRFKQPISKTILWSRKSKIRSENSGQLWLSYFTRIGYVFTHKKLIELSERLIDSSMHELFLELQKPYEIKDAVENDVGTHLIKSDAKILKLKYDIRESIKLMRDLMLDSPIVAEIKVHLESGFKLRLKLLEQYGLDVDDDGNIVDYRKGINNRKIVSANSIEKDSEAVF